MANKESFTPQEWVRVVASPLVASMAITAADPSGLWGLLKEGMAGGGALLGAKQSTGANPLVRSVVEDFARSETRDAARDWVQSQFKGSAIGDVKRKAVEELRQVSAILDRVAAQDAGRFKAWLRDVAQETATAGNEGGFLGFGGVAVSEAEKATLAELSVALGARSA